jgi:hypothetical protein
MLTENYLKMWQNLYRFNENKRDGIRFIPAVTKRRLYCMRLCARPFGFFFLSCFATLGVWPRTFPARANEPWTLPASYHYDFNTYNSGALPRSLRGQHIDFGKQWLYLTMTSKQWKEWRWWSWATLNFTATEDYKNCRDYTQYWVAFTPSSIR